VPPLATPVRPVPTVAPTRTPVPPQPTAPLTTPPSPTSAPPPVSYSAPVLVSPGDGEPTGLPMTLRWAWDGTLQDDEFFDVRLWREGGAPVGIAWTKSREFVLSSPSYQGFYLWSVAVIRGQNGDLVAELSPAAPARLVSISPGGNPAPTTAPPTQPAPTQPAPQPTATEPAPEPTAAPPSPEPEPTRPEPEPSPTR
jgi:hypothetical protein